jgi:hypothetical protein
MATFMQYVSHKSAAPPVPIALPTTSQQKYFFNLMMLNIWKNPLVLHIPNLHIHIEGNYLVI